MEPVTQSDFLDQVGPKGWRYLRYLSRLLDQPLRREGNYPLPNPDDFIGRIAPSLVTRGEAEIFGLSAPRFAYRVLLGKPGKPPSIVNIRRLQRLAENLKRAHVAEDQLPPHPPEGLSPPDRAKLEKEVGDHHLCIADSLLVPPGRLRRTYRILEVECGRAYGEGKIRGTPYLQHFRLSGGMCAQANAYMVLVLLQEHVHSILGIAEIPAVNSSSPGLVELTGMTPGELAAFLNHERIGLRSFVQLVQDRGTLRTGWLTAALRSYLLSDIPVIVLVDSNRLAGVPTMSGIPIYPRNKMKVDARNPRGEHAVLLTGCHRRKADEFLLNDPASFPFLQASVHQLYEARCHREDVPDDKLDESTLGPFRFLPVTPPKVNLPFLDFWPGRTVETSRAKPLSGLRRHLEKLQPVFAPQVHPTLPRYDPSRLPGELRLVELGDATSADLRRRFPHLPREAIRWVLDSLKGGLLSHGWYWIQFLDTPDFGNRFRRSLWFWNAETRRYRDNDGEALAAVLAENTKGWQTVFFHRPADPPPASSVASSGVALVAAGDRASSEIEGHSSGQPALQPALLTSFSTLGVTWYGHRLEPLRRSPRAGVPVEVYMMMEPEVEKWRAHFGDDPQPAGGAAAVDFLANLNTERMGRIARELDRNIRFYGSHIIALASFLPEIGRRPTRSNLGRRALSNVLRFGRILQKEFDHPVRCVELVAGSCIDALWTSRADPQETSEKKQETRYYLERIDPIEAGNRFLDSLTSTFECLLQKDPDFDIPLAVELEPGPYFTVNGWEALEALAELLDRHPLLSPHVGFNLDVSHFRLGNIPDRRLRAVPAIRQRIVHAHLSGSHPRGHLGDIVPLAIDDFGVYEPWLQLLHDLTREARPKGMPRFSGYVSLELEAARDENVVRDGLEQLDWMLKRIPRRRTPPRGPAGGRI